MTPVQRVRDALEAHDCRPRGPAHKFEARCPAHDDRNPSLSVSTGGDGRALLKCHTGCELADILDALRLSETDLFEESNGGRDILATYPYEDESGELLFEVVRFAPKDFRQRRPDGAGDWEWSLNGTRRVPYRLPKVLEAAQAGEKVVVVEGEKDVHALEGRGVVATCNPGGAGRWRDEYSQHLRGAKVAVIADRDGPGRAHAQAVAGSLGGVAAQVRVFEPAEGKDIADHLAAGRSLRDLVGVSGEGSGGRKLRAVPSGSIRAVRTEWLWQGWIPLRAVTLVAGYPGLGKSTLSLELAARLSRGELSGALYGKAGKALVLSFEDAANTVIIPRFVAAGGAENHLFILEVRQGGHSAVVDLQEDLSRIEELVVEHDIQLVVIDPLMAGLRPDRTDSHREQDVRRALVPVADIAERRRLAVIGVMHLNKSQGSNILQRVSGSTAFGGLARSVLAFGQDPEDPDGDLGTRRIIVHGKCNVGRRMPSLACHIEDAMIYGNEGEPIPTSQLVFDSEVQLDMARLLSAPGAA